MDYFIEAEYDAAQFLPVKIPSKSAVKSKYIDFPLYDPMVTQQQQQREQYSLSDIDSNYLPNFASLYNFNENDWELVQKSRRTRNTS